MTRRSWFKPALAATVLLLAAAAHAAPPLFKAGDTPPDVVGQSLGGDPVVLSQHAGKAVVLSFWATWCKYCMKELPILANIRKAGKGKIDVIAVNTEDEDTFRRVARVMKNLDLVLGNDPDEEAQRAYGVHGIPHMVIIGRDGKIVEVFRGYGESSLPEIVAAINKAMAVEL
jgi:thiol-disulfide isomerase/thioredoxin